MAHLSNAGGKHFVKVAFLPSSWGFLVFTWDSWWAFYKLYQAVLKWVRIAHYLSQSGVTVFPRFKIKTQIYFYPK